MVKSPRYKPPKSRWISFFLGNMPKSSKCHQRSPTIDFFRKGIGLATPPPQNAALSLPGHKKGHLGNPSQNNSIVFIFYNKYRNITKYLSGIII